MRWATLSEIEEYVKKSRGTISKWVKRYNLTTRREGSTILVDTTEISAIEDATSRLVPTPQLIAVLFARVQKLEQEVLVLNYAAGEYKSTRMTVEEANTWLATMIHLAEGDIPHAMHEEALETIALIGEDLLDTLEEAGHIRPWLPAWLAVSNLAAGIRANPRFHMDLVSQNLYDRAAKLRLRIRNIALLYIEADLDADARAALRNIVGDAPLLDDLVARRLYTMQRLAKKTKEASVIDLVDQAKKAYLEGTTLYEKGRAARLLSRAARMAFREFRSLAVARTPKITP